MKISIAMTTFNGARYVREQLDSFARQSRRPDELVVSDDASTDGTVAIVQAFAARVPFEVRWSVNANTVGFAANFDRAIQQCAGDLIFLSDQDDVWLPGKLARMEAEFRRSPDVLLVMCDAALVHADGSPTGLTKRGQILALGLSEERFLTGCCMAIRRSLARLLAPVPTEAFVHDAWINKLAVSLNAKRVIPEVLQQFRRHGDNASASIASRTERLSRSDLLRRNRARDSRAACLRRNLQARIGEGRLRERGQAALAQPGFEARLREACERLSRERRAVEARLAVLARGRWRRPPALLNCWRRGHYRFFSGWKSAVKDLVSS